MENEYRMKYKRNGKERYWIVRHSCWNGIMNLLHELFSKTDQDKLIVVIEKESL